MKRGKRPAQIKLINLYKGVKPMKKFEVGTKYFDKGDGGIVYTMEVIKRTDKTVTINDIFHKEVIRRAIKYDKSLDCEYIKVSCINIYFAKNEYSEETAGA